MSFFEPPAPPPEPPDAAFERKPWWGAPRNEIGVSTGLRLVLARTDEIALAVIDAVAYSIGLSFTLAVLRRTPSESHRPEDPLGRFAHARGMRELPPDLLRLGIELSDGRKATTLGMPMVTTSEEETEPQGPYLVPGGGGGGDDYWESSFWLWPLPTPGPLAFVVEWPAEGIALTRHEVEAEPILEAARQAETLWPPAPSSSGGVSWTDY